MSRWTSQSSLPTHLSCIALVLAASATLAAHADIPNGTCQTAETVTAGKVIVPNADASPSGADQTNCGIITRMAWYRYTAPADVDVTFEVTPFGSTTDSVLGAVTSCGQYITECEVASSTNPARLHRVGMRKGDFLYLVVAVSDFSTPANAVLLVTEEASTCGAGGPAVTCCLGGDWTGCNDAECCTAICAYDPYCCDQAWDANCSNLARLNCSVCLAPDCNGNEVNDSVEFGPNRSMLLSTYHYLAIDGSPYDFCPQVHPSKQVGMVVVGRLVDGSPREIEVCDCAQTATIDIAGASALFYPSPKSAASISVTGDDGIRIAASGAAAPAELALRYLSVDTTHLEVGRGASEGTLLIEGSDVFAGSLDVFEGSVIVGGMLPSGEPVNGDLAIAASSFIGDNARLQMFEGSSVVLLSEVSEPMIVRGLVDLAPDSMFAGNLAGTLASSWLRTAGQIDGSVQWAGCIRPESACTITGSLTIVPLQDGPAARYLWTAAAGSSRLLTVGGTATLGGTLYIDATGASAGSSASIIRAGGFEGAFDSVQVFGLPPQLALVVAPVSGGAMSELRAQVVTVAQLLGYGEGENYPLELEPKDTVTADFDNDGLDDLAVSLSAGPAQPGAIAVFRGTGSGLQQVSQISVGTDPRGLDSADFDVDGKADLVVALAGDDAVRVLRNTTVATISFNALAPIPVGNEPVDVAALDFFVEGASLASSGKDVLVAVAGDSTFVALKNNDGTISSSGSTTTPSPGGIPTSVGGGDVDNDRVDDGVGGTSGGTTIIPGGAGSFAGSAVIFLPTPHPVTSVTLADLNGDGGLDIAATLDANAPRPTPPGTPLVYDTLALIENRPAGYNTTLFDYGYRGRTLARGDFDADGDEDLAFASRDDLAGPAQLRIVRNDMSAAGALLTRQTSPAIDVEPLVVGTISIDGNGDDVLALGPGTSDAASNLFLQRFAEPALFGDIDGDGAVGASDMSILLLNWGQPGASDLDGNGTTDAVDIGLLLDRWSRK